MHLAPHLVTLGLTLALLAPRPGHAAEPRHRSVRFVYLVSADREVRRDYHDAIADAARTIQAFYASQLGGRTFTLNEPIVEVVRSDKPAAWFYAHDTGSAKDNWGFDNGLAEARRLLGAGHQQDYIWVIYSDGPGNSGRGGAGVAVMPEDDLLGLVGQHPTQPDARRWVYGMAHELGHALGLAHPDDPDAVPEAIMGGGFYTCFPDRCALTDADREALRDSPFLHRPGAAPTRPAAPLARYRYDRGTFERTSEGGRTRWTERTDDGGRFTFDEVGAYPEGFLINDPGRLFVIWIPRAGGQSRHSLDGAQTWRSLYIVRAEAP